MTGTLVGMASGLAKHGLGDYGERLAVAHLTGLGMRLLSRNWRCAQGEIDIVALDPSGPVLVFCEVKTRSATGYGLPTEAVGRAKAARLRRLGAAWLAAHDHPYLVVRFDVVGVLRPLAGPAAVEHLRGVL